MAPLRPVSERLPDPVTLGAEPRYRERSRQLFCPHQCWRRKPDGREGSAREQLPLETSQSELVDGTTKHTSNDREQEEAEKREGGVSNINNDDKNSEKSKNSTVYSLLHRQGYEKSKKIQNQS